MKIKISLKVCHGSEVGLKYKFCVRIFANIMSALLRKLLAKIFENGEKQLRNFFGFSSGFLQKRQRAKICASQEQCARQWFTRNFSKKWKESGVFAVRENSRSFANEYEISQFRENERRHFRFNPTVILSRRKHGGEVQESQCRWKSYRQLLSFNFRHKKDGGGKVRLNQPWHPARIPASLANRRILPAWPRFHNAHSVLKE